MIRIKVLSALSTVVLFASTCVGQTEGTFTEPDSVLLFETETSVAPYLTLLVASNSGTAVVRSPKGFSGSDYSTVFPTLAPSADRLAWGLTTRDDTGRQQRKAVLGVYSLLEKSWKTYGDFCGSGIGSVAFSPDGTKVAFASKSAYSSGNQFCFNNPTVLQILDLKTGNLTPISYEGRVEEHARLSWSPEGKYLAGQFCCSASSTYQIVVIDLASGNGKVIAEGRDPAWSPKGDWISFDDQKSRKCTIIHPDGTAAKVVQDLRKEWMFPGIGSSSLMFLKGAIWSPDGDKLLFNEEGIDTGGNVTILDLPSGKRTTRSKSVLFVLGWAKKPND